MFSDHATINVTAGAGGDGSVSFRREAHVPKGGPDGGDGGRGGDVVLLCDGARRDLSEFQRGAHITAGRGGHGEGSQRHGASAAEKIVKVPPGTVAEDHGRGVRFDLTRPGQRAVVARGGGGGRGNKAFAGPTRQSPRMAERGIAGEEGTLDLRLKLLADAGLVGVPNAGKSSLLASLTRARPKVAGYPFTTIDPVLGTIEVGERQLVLADIPGLIEGAGQGVGLGHEFLAHVERCRVLVHVIDVAPLDGSDPLVNHATVEAELREHGAGLERLPRVLCLSKTDLIEPEEIERFAQQWRERLGDAVLGVVTTSSATGDGLEQLRGAVIAAVPEQDLPDMPDDVEAGEIAATHRVYRPGAGDELRVERAPSGAFRILGERVERLFARHDLDNEESLRYLEDRLRSIGAIKALERAGFEPGDDVEIAGTVFELDPGAPLDG